MSYGFFRGGPPAGGLWPSSTFLDTPRRTPMYKSKLNPLAQASLDSAQLLVALLPVLRLAIFAAGEFHDQADKVEK
jgi:hypothetical protein